MASTTQRKVKDQQAVQLQYCQPDIQQKFYRELRSAPPAEQPRRGARWIPFGFCLGAAGFSTMLGLGCRIICELTAWLNFQDVLIY